LKQLAEKILAETRNQGAISFARFMELALYCPVYGYYEKEGDTVGQGGDFYTSVSVGPLFGELLALQFSEWLEALGTGDPGADLSPSGVPDSSLAPPGKPGAQVEPSHALPACEREYPPRPLQIIEAGAHNGQLALDILGWLRRYRPALLSQIEYCVIEPSTYRQQWQRRTLDEFAGKVCWVKDWAELSSRDNRSGSGRLSAGGISGVIFANELLDAMPVHRLGWDANRRGWFEWGVTAGEGGFAWTRLMKNDGSPAPEWPQELLDRLPDGFTIELCPAADRWWAEAARNLDAGKLVTLDYGLTSDELLSPARTEGTLRGYYRHQPAADVLSNPGEQDITAHVNFSKLRQIGESAGLKTEGLLAQERFLTSIARRVLKGEAAFGEWTSARTRQFQTLTHPSHLGRAFRILVQSRK
jgi:SAM-dependent MidA family methyltransferase